MKANHIKLPIQILMSLWETLIAISIVGCEGINSTVSFELKFKSPHWVVNGLR